MPRKKQPPPHKPYTAAEVAAADQAKVEKEIAKIKKEGLPPYPEYIGGMEPRSGDVGFTHAVFTQCFLPLRKPKDPTIHQAKHGRATLLIEAGRLYDPKTGDFIQQTVPYGPAARLCFAHINNHIIRSKAAADAVAVPLGESLREFFRTNKLSIGGKNAQQIVQQMHNIAAAHIAIGWKTTDNHAKQKRMPAIAEEIDFWLEKDDQQRTLWQPTITLNEQYVLAIREHKVPHDMRALVGLYANPRAMDIYLWLSYRLPTVKNAEGVFVPYWGENGLQAVFGQGISDKHKFKQAFLDGLKKTLEFYPYAVVRPEKTGVRLFRSPSPVPAELSNKPSLFFGVTAKNSKRRLVENP